MKHLAFIILGLAIMLSAGCGGGHTNGSSETKPVVYTSLAGTITLPDAINSELLTSIRPAQNTDSEVRKAFSSALVWVNDQPTNTSLIIPSAVTSEWDFRILNIPQSSTGIYKILVTVGKLSLKGWVTESEKDSFKINALTTAAALLADSTQIGADTLMASFPAMVSKIALHVESAFSANLTEVTTGIFGWPALKTEIASQSDFLKKNKGFDPNALVAYLGYNNDLNGDGLTDFKISQTIDRTGIRFETGISSLTSMATNIEKLGSYSDDRLFADFRTGNTRYDRTFDSSAVNIALGMLFQKGANSDKYLKLLIKQVDLHEGTFSGVIAEYSFASASGTAIATGTRTFLLKGTKEVLGAVEGSDFLTDSVATNGVLVYIDPEKGLGNLDTLTRMVRAVDGQPELNKLSSAETFAETSTGYQTNTANALKAINKSRGLEIGDVFSAYFKKTRHYALFKVKTMDTQTVTVDFIVNRAVDEPRF